MFLIISTVVNCELLIQQKRPQTVTNCNLADDTTLVEDSIAKTRLWTSGCNDQVLVYSLADRRRINYLRD